jgi:hypothetical protein
VLQAKFARTALPQPHLVVRPGPRLKTYTIIMSNAATASASASSGGVGSGTDDHNNGNPQAGQNRPLPKKESDLFKNVVKFYESKQYKKGLKNADAILKRFPNPGETLCMKGLIVNAMASALWGGEGAGGGGSGGGKQEGKEPVADKKKEAVELVKRGLMMDMRYVDTETSSF